MAPARKLKKLGFLHIVPFERGNPRKGLEEALELFEYAEALGLDGGWIRTRHLQYGVSSAATFLAAASQRTKRIDLGTAVIPTAYESPLRLAEDLATADLLSGGRLQPGLSVGQPRYTPNSNELVFGPNWQHEDFSYGRIEKFLSFLRGDTVNEEAGQREFEIYSERIEPHSPGLDSRIWYGGGSLGSAKWAGKAGLKFLVSNISRSEEGITDFSEAQSRQIDLFRANHPAGEAAVVAQGHVLVPTDNTTSEQRARFADYVDQRTARTLAPGENGRLVEKDQFGSTNEIVDQLLNDPAFQRVDEFLFELPFVFNQEDYKHILREVALNIGPALGWQPKV